MPLTDVIGILAPGAFGDIALATGVLTYANTLWPQAERVHWYVADQYRDMVCWEPHVHIWRGVTDSTAYPLCTRIYKGVAWLDEPRKDVPLPVQSRRLFGICDDAEWHPMLRWTGIERCCADEFMAKLPRGHVNVMLETRQRSDQSAWDAATTAYVIAQCRKRWPGRVNILLASHLQRTLGDDTFSCTQFTVRQCCLLYNRCHAFFGCSSGISAATCNWNANRDVKRALYIRSDWCSLKSVAWGTHREAQSFGAFSDAVQQTLGEVQV